jgi:hypothetical protein
MEVTVAVLAWRNWERPLKPSLIIFGIEAEIRKAYLPDAGKVFCSLMYLCNYFVFSSAQNELAVVNICEIPLNHLLTSNLKKHTHTHAHAHTHTHMYIYIVCSNLGQEQTAARFYCGTDEPPL